MVSTRNAFWSWSMLIVVIVGVVLYAGGFLSGARIVPGDVALAAQAAPPVKSVDVERRRIVVIEEAVGSVNSRRTIQLAAQLPARVTGVAVEAGASVRAGDVLVTLDEREISARLAQARQALLAAEAGIARARQGQAQADARATQAAANRERTATLLAQRAATNEQMEAADAAHLAAQAGLADGSAAVAMAEAERERAAQAVNEAEIAFGYTKIAAPIDGVVAQRMVEAGDLASPGRPLLVLLDADALRLEAHVREGLLDRVKVGDALEIEFANLAQRVPARVSEVLPSADPRTRTVEVRAEFERVEGLLPGTFGRLRIPAGEREVVLAPQAAIVRVGQLTSVQLDEGGRWLRRAVSVGESFDGGLVEVLSGLDGGERIALDLEAPR